MYTPSFPRAFASALPSLSLRALLPFALGKHGPQAMERGPSRRGFASRGPVPVRPPALVVLEQGVVFFKGRFAVAFDGMGLKNHSPIMFLR